MRESYFCQGCQTERPVAEWLPAQLKKSGGRKCNVCLQRIKEANEKRKKK